MKILAPVYRSSVTLLKTLRHACSLAAPKVCETLLATAFFAACSVTFCIAFFGFFFLGYCLSVVWSMPVKDGLAAAVGILAGSGAVVYVIFGLCRWWVRLWRQARHSVVDNTNRRGI